MKIPVLIISLFFTSTFNLKAQDHHYSNHVKDVDTTIKTLYEVISGEKGEARNWDLFKYLFHKDAKLIPTGKTQDGITQARYMTPNDYINTSGRWLIENGFYEKEISRKTESFGPVTHVFSTYQSCRSESDKTPFMRGINSIQLLFDGERYWIINIYWSSETEDLPIPKKYLE